MSKRVARLRITLKPDSTTVRFESRSPRGSYFSTGSVAVPTRDLEGTVDQDGLYQAILTRVPEKTSV